ncbi:MAG: hypothetical protein KatS3mg060_1480 [Dehalococcoidia bacterium]|nr:MAG: hypothetical protein KatS3mg060_1480 [Dehalococcoidia bacterium]
MHTYSRRRVLQAVAALAGAGALPPSLFAQTERTPTLLEVARLAGESITARLDRERGFQPYFHLDITSDPPEGLHSSWDYVDTAGRFVAAFLALRELGLQVDREAEAGVRRFFLANQGEDGLFYDQQSEWSERAAESFAQSRAMAALVELALAGDREAEQRIDRHIAALVRISEPLGDGLGLPGRRYRDGWLDRSLTALGADDRIAKPGYAALVAEPLIRYAAAAGHHGALSLASSLIRGFFAAGAIRDDGRFIGHTHSWGILPVTIALVELGSLTGDRELIEFARLVFDVVVSEGTPWGWIPDGIGFASGYPGGWFCETCGLADAIVLGIRLGQLGHERAWSDVERFVRNQLIANQLREVDRVLPLERAAQSRTNAAAILRGSFEAWARPNSLLGGLDLLEHGGLEACCTGSAVMAIREVARAAAVLRDGTLWIDLPLTLRTSLAEIESSEPRDGVLMVTPHISGPIAIRLPSGAEPASVDVDGVPAAFEFRTGTLFLAGVPGRRRVVVRYPLVEREERQVAGGLAVTARWRGATVVAIDPPGERYPIFRNR